MSVNFPFQSRVNGSLFLEGLEVEALAEKYGTPTYVYSEAGIKESFLAYKDAFSGIDSLICVSIKANSNLSLLSLLAKLGAGFDVVSRGELSRAMASGGDAAKVVFSGVGKTDQEIRDALSAGILMINVESEPELERINFLAAQLGTKAPVSFRINPDVDAKTHAYISTGMEKHKFGIPFERANELYRSGDKYPAIEFVGVDCHVGSMITDLSVFDEAFQRMANYVRELKSAVPTLRIADLGGGLAVQYKDEIAPSVAAYAQLVEKHFKDLGLKIVMEPGRSIFANSGLLLTRVLYVKNTSKKSFVIVDAGFNDLIRPALYEAYHEIVPARLGTDSSMTADIVGPVCESGDCFAHDRSLPEVKAGDLLVIQSAGAYGYVMASVYNSRPRPAEVLVSGSTSRVVKPRVTVEELFQDELQLLNM